MTINEVSDLGIVGEDLLENLQKIKESVSEIKKAEFKEETEFEGTQGLKDNIEETINMIKINLTKLKEK